MERAIQKKIMQQYYEIREDGEDFSLTDMWRNVQTLVDGTGGTNAMNVVLHTKHMN